MKNVEEEFAGYRTRYNHEVSEKNARIIQLEQEKRQREEDFDRLFDIKISLERELMVYRQLLDSAENNLSLNNARSPIRIITHFNLRAEKVNPPNILISDYDTDRVVLYNVSDDDYTLQRSTKLKAYNVDRQELGNYEFMNDVIIERHSQITVWINDNNNTVRNDTDDDFYAPIPWTTDNHLFVELLGPDQRVYIYFI